MSAKRKKDIGAICHQKGVSFRVWAPFASSVAVTGSFNNWSESPMVSENDGYWSADIASAEAGQEYKFVIRNGESTLYRNDPRALQFTTSAGNSIIVDTDFDWEDDAFVPPSFNRQVIYELHVGTFARADPSTPGTFDDVAAKLDYLSNLGINMIELMPISSMSNDRGWGYAPDYLYSVESLYGGRHRFQEFVKAAHKRGIGVVVDVVYNHFGPDNKLDLWQFDGWSENGLGGIYFYNDWRAETPWGSTRPDIGRTEVQQYILDNVRMWMTDCHVDGLRADATHFIRNVKGYNNDPSNDLPEGWALLQKINTLVHKINPQAITMAEDISGNEYITKKTSEGGAGFGAQWHLMIPRALRDALCPAFIEHINLTGICAELGQRYNNDVFQRVVFMDSHDTAANGSMRLNEYLSPGDSDNKNARKKSLVAAGIIMTMPGIPMLFQGQEFMTGGSFSDWEALDWQMAKKHAGIVAAYRDLIRLRLNISNCSSGLSAQCLNLSHVDDWNKVIAYHRWEYGGPGDDVLVIANFADRHQPCYSLSFPRNGKWRVRFLSSAKQYNPDFKEEIVEDITVESGVGTIVLPPLSLIILSQ